MTNAEYFRDKLILGGNYDNGPFHEIAAWDGTGWDNMEGGLRGDAWVYSLRVYQDLLFVGGEFLRSAGNPSSYLMAWNGSAWINPFPDVRYLSQVTDLQVIDGVLYLVGPHDYPGLVGSRVSVLARYDGKEFCSFGGEGFNAYGIEGLGGKLFVSTSPVTGGYNIGHIAMWIGEDSVDNCILQSPLLSEDPVTQQLTLAPNPTTQSFSIQLPEGFELAQPTLALHDLQGRSLLPPRAYAGEEIDVGGLPAGMYLVEVRSRGGRQVLKLVRE